MNKVFLAFLSHHTSLEAILNDHKLASLGDAYVNFIYSLALSKKKGEATGTKVSSHTLSQALKKTKLRKFLPQRMDRHSLGDAAEGFIIYAWIQGAITIEESVAALSSSENAVEAFANLLLLARERLDL